MTGVGIRYVRQGERGEATGVWRERGEHWRNEFDHSKLISSLSPRPRPYSQLHIPSSILTGVLDVIYPSTQQPSNPSLARYSVSPLHADGY